MKHFVYEAPETLARSEEILRQENAVLSAGGTDLVGVLKE